MYFDAAVLFVTFTFIQIVSNYNGYTKVHSFPSLGRNQVCCACSSAKTAHKPDITEVDKKAKSLLS